jgi:NAD(P)H-hydrate epimerase
MEVIDNSILGQLKKPNPDSHKGDNGRVLVIAGSDKYHGALLLTIQSASRLVDMVYVYSVEQNLELVKKLKSEISVFISVVEGELWKTVDLVDVVLVGPGLEEGRANKRLVEKLLKKYPEKKTIVDATTFWHLDPLWLHQNCIVTPHSREFENTFKCAPTPENVLKMAKYYQCTVVLKGKYDYVSDGKVVYKNRTGNVGMTKGGTGDVLAGLITGFAATNDLLTSAKAGVYLNGLAGDKLFEKQRTFYNAEDLVGEIGICLKELA